MNPQPRSDIVIVLDSTAYLPEELYTKHGITVVPLSIVHPDGSLEQELGIEPGPYFDALAGSKELPTTAPTSPEQFVDVYRPLLADGKEIVSIHLSSALSETCANARQAAASLTDEGGHRVHIIDSATACGAIGLMGLAAARRIQEGGDVVDVVNVVSEARAETRTWFSIDNLDYLRRGGRIGGAAAWMGTTLKIKPILSIGSQITAVERVRTWEKALDKMVEFGRKLHENGADAWFLHYAANRGDADLVAERLQDVFWRHPEFVTPVGPVIGTHLGPRVIALGGCPARFLE